MNETKEITIYEQAGKFYCEDCKPQGKSRRGTLIASKLIVSKYDHFCAGCGEDFLDIAEQKEAK